MKKYSLLVALLLGLMLQLNAQIRFGLKAGLGSTDLDVSNVMVDEPGLQDRLNLALKDANYSFRFGAQLRIPFGNAFILQPEVVFNSNTVEFGVDDLNQGGLGQQVFEESYQYIDVPILAGWELGPLRIQAGPTAHFFLNATSDLFDFDDYDQNFNDMTFGYLFGAGLDLWNLTLDIRREGNFTKFGSHIRFGESRFEFDDSPARWLFSLGYMFGDRR
ncbi:MAG: hypothetical protein Sapg2KO_04740 [Saprospiraceae bacterium]